MKVSRIVNSVKIRSIQAEESKYEILIPLLCKQIHYGLHSVENLHEIGWAYKYNGIRHCYRADKTTTLLELSLKVLSIKFEWGATSKKFASILLRN